MRRIKFNNSTRLFVLGLVLLLSFLSTAWAQSIGLLSSKDDEIYMLRGDIETIKAFNLKRISLTNPQAADIANIYNDEITVIAKEYGDTTLFIWDKYGKRSVVIHVTREDLVSIKSRVEKLLAKTDIRGIALDINPKEGKVLVSGSILKEDREALNDILDPFKDSLINLTKEEESTDLIQIDGQIFELNTNFSTSLGLDWTSALSYGETRPTGHIENFGDMFKLGKFSRTSGIVATLNALITEGKGRVLSKPKLVVTSGKEATMLIGGEVPVTETTTTTGGVVSQNVTFKDYGVTLNVKPTLKKDDKIDVELEIEVSDIDAANSLGGNPAFSTRNTKTQLFLEDRQTVVFAGLIKKTESRTVSRIPFLSDIPLAGAFFRKKSNTTPDKDLELVITLTPTILREEKSKGQTSVSTSEIKPTPKQDLAQEKAVKNSSSLASVSGGAITTPTFIPKEIVPYAKSIQEKMAQRIVYPEEARRHGWQGTVKLALHLFNDGSLASASIRESSGYDLFDEDVLKLAQDLAPYEGFPANQGLEELTITIPIVYSLDSSY